MGGSITSEKHTVQFHSSGTFMSSEGTSSSATGVLPALAVFFCFFTVGAVGDVDEDPTDHERGALHVDLLCPVAPQTVQGMVIEGRCSRTYLCPKDQAVS